MVWLDSNSHDGLSITYSSIYNIKIGNKWSGTQYTSMIACYTISFSREFPCRKSHLGARSNGQFNFVSSVCVFLIFYNLLIFILKLLPTGNLQTVTDCCRFIADCRIFHYKDLHLGCSWMLSILWFQAFLNLCSDCSSVFLSTK